MLACLRPPDDRECLDVGLAVASHFALSNSPVPLSTLPPPALLALVLPNSIPSRTSSSRDEPRHFSLLLSVIHYMLALVY